MGQYPFSRFVSLLCMLLLIGACLALGACANSKTAGAPSSAEDSADPADPWEGFNRAMFSLNNIIDSVLLKPVAQAYRFVVPEKGREAVHNVVENFSSPVDFANSALQGDVQNTFATFWRFVLNSTIGLGGIYDVAGREGGLTARQADFGQTLGVWGLESGPYLFLPVFGPSNVRDAVGIVPDMYAHPAMYMDTPWPAVVAATTAVDKRSQNYKLIEDVKRDSLDPYSTFRSGYLQRRASEVKRARQAAFAPPSAARAASAQPANTATSPDIKP